MLRVGTEGVYSPFSFHDPATGELVGYDVDVAKAVGQKLGVKVEFVETPWDSMFAALEADRFDVVANQVTVNPERQAKYDLSQPYTVGEGVIVTRADDDSITSLADLKGKTAAENATSNWSEVAPQGRRQGRVGRRLQPGHHAAQPGPRRRRRQRQHRRLRLPRRDRRQVGEDRGHRRREERAGPRRPEEQRHASRARQGARRVTGRRNAFHDLAEVPQGRCDGNTAVDADQVVGCAARRHRGTYSPFSYHDPATGQLAGYDVDVAKAVAENLGVKVEFVETPWDSIFAALEANRFDVVANEVTLTPERQAKYDLSEPYSVGEGVIVTKADDDSIKSLADLKGKTTAQSITSNWAQVARDAGANVESVEGFSQAITLLNQAASTPP